MNPDQESLAPIDWSLTTWEGSRREQLRRWSALPLEDIVRGLEEMQELAERLASGPDLPERTVSDRRPPGSGE